MAVSGIFIFGYMHCGTTLIQKILAKHESIYCKKKEIKFIQFLTRIKQLYPNLKIASKRREYIAFCFFAIENAIVPNSKLEEFPLNTYLSRSVDFSTESVDHLTIYFQAYRYLAGTHTYWMEGTPNNVFYHHEIRQRCPDAKFIIIVRDVRDVLTSKKRRRETTNSHRYPDKEILRMKKMEKNYSCVVDSLSWASTYTVCKNLKDNDPNTFVVRYEDLTTRPDVIVQSLCRFLNLRYDDKLVSVRFSNSAQTKIARGGIFANSGNYLRALSGGEIYASQVITKNLLKRFDYSPRRVSVADKLHSLSVWAEFVPHLAARVWKRYRLLGFWNFVSFIRMNLVKIRTGILKFN